MAHWEQASYDGRRALLRLAWSRILIAKAANRDGQFDESRIVYVPVQLPHPVWQPPEH